MTMSAKTIEKSVEMEQMRHVWKDSVLISPTVAKAISSLKIIMFLSIRLATSLDKSDEKNGIRSSTRHLINSFRNFRPKYVRFQTH